MRYLDGGLIYAVEMRRYTILSRYIGDTDIMGIVSYRWQMRHRPIFDKFAYLVCLLNNSGKFIVVFFGQISV